VISACGPASPLPADDAAGQNVPRCTTLGRPGIWTLQGTAAAGITFTQSGTVAVARTVQSKLTDFASVKDFGATGNGTSDDSAAWTAASAATNTVRVRPGTYQLGHVVTAAANTTFLFDSGVTVNCGMTDPGTSSCCLFQGGDNITPQGNDLPSTVPDELWPAPPAG